MSHRIASLAAPLLTLKAPLLATVATFALFGGAVAVLTLTGEAPRHLTEARGEVSSMARTAENSHDDTSHGVRSDDLSHDGEDGINFVEDEPGADVQLTGAPAGFDEEVFVAAPSAEEADHAQDSQIAAIEPGPANPNALPPAPISGLSEPGPGGPLPVVGGHGERVSREYARPFHGDPASPTLAIVIGGMGLNPQVTQAAINDLPPEVALSFASSSDNLQTWIDRARAAGHEVLLEAPMEPYDYPNNDPGPYTLLADGTPSENTRRLLWVMSRATGYYGITNYLGARFSASEGALTHVLEDLEERGVAFLHDGAGRRNTIDSAARSAGVEYAIADRILDENPTPDAIDNHLLALEALALQNGSAIGSGFAFPATVDQVQRWAEGLDLRGYQLAPPSAVMARRRLEARLLAEAQAAEPDVSVTYHGTINTGGDHGSESGHNDAEDTHTADAGDH